MRLLVLNPNTSEPVTLRLVASVRAVLGPAVDVRGTTASFGARYIADEAGFAIAGHAALAAYSADAAEYGEPDAVLLGCFGDPAVWALREVARRPVVGLAEAAMREAAAHGDFAIVTGGAAWGPMLRRIAASFGLADALADVQLVEPSGAQLAADPAMAHRVLLEACRRAAARARVVILGGAGLAGLGDAIRPHLEVPLIDSVAAGARAIASHHGAQFLASTRGATKATDWTGVDPALRTRLGPRAENAGG